MSGRFKEYNPHQMFLLPRSLKEWLPEDHLAYFVCEVVDQLDLCEIMKAYEGGDGRGQPACHPAMMVKLVFDAYCVGVAPSRKIEARMYREFSETVERTVRSRAQELRSRLKKLD